MFIYIKCRGSLYMPWYTLADMLYAFLWRTLKHHTLSPIRTAKHGKNTSGRYHSESQIYLWIYRANLWPHNVKPNILWTFHPRPCPSWVFRRTRRFGWAFRSRRWGWCQCTSLWLRLAYTHKCRGKTTSLNTIIAF